MSRKPPRRGRIIPVLFFTFVGGVVTGWWIRDPLTTLLSPMANTSAIGGQTGDVPLAPSSPASASMPEPARNDRASEARRTTDPERNPTAHLSPDADRSQDAFAALARRNLRLPVDGADVAAMHGQFGNRRDDGARGHEAVDILAPRNTPVYAVDDGAIAKLFLSAQGGITVYQFDPTGRFCYYYAHLERYAPDLHEGQQVARGDIIGAVGTTGNAPPDTPHLHFAIFELTPERHWWQGNALDPWMAFRR